MGEDRKAAALRPAAVDALELARSSVRQWWRDAAWRDLIGLTIVLGAALVLPNFVPAPVPLLAGLVALAIAAALVLPRHRKVSRKYRQGWAGALPVSGLARWIAVLAPILSAALLVGAMLALAVMLSWPASVALGIASGVVGGSVLAVAWSGRRIDAAYPDSRYRISATRKETAGTLDPVVCDLHARVSSRLQPRTLARILAPLLVVVPTGLPVLDALATLSALAGGIYGHALFAEIRSHAVATRDWLAATPVDFAKLRRRLQRSVRVRFAACGLAIAPLLIEATDPLVALISAVPVAVSLDRLAAHRLRLLGSTP